MFTTSFDAPRLDIVFNKKNGERTVVSRHFYSRRPALCNKLQPQPLVAVLNAFDVLGNARKLSKSAEEDVG